MGWKACKSPFPGSLTFARLGRLGRLGLLLSEQAMQRRKMTGSSAGCPEPGPVYRGYKARGCIHGYLACSVESCLCETFRPFGAVGMSVGAFGHPVSEGQTLFCGFTQRAARGQMSHHHVVAVAPAHLEVGRPGPFLYWRMNHASCYSREHNAELGEVAADGVHRWFFDDSGHSAEGLGGPLYQPSGRLLY